MLWYNLPKKTWPIGIGVTKIRFSSHLCTRKQLTPISTTVIQICKCEKPQKIISYFYMLSTPRIFSNSLLLPLNLRYLHLVSFLCTVHTLYNAWKMFYNRNRTAEKCYTDTSLYHPWQCLFIDCAFIFTENFIYTRFYTFNWCRI